MSKKTVSFNYSKLKNGYFISDGNLKEVRFSFDQIEKTKAKSNKEKIIKKIRESFKIEMTIKIVINEKEFSI